ncbi:hypothetical protein PQX77_017014 [Marasmius sp. AFHP31]|nr:hypothetical protein PQX77_017014 [Marasmius sp. AFHP31]
MLPSGSSLLLMLPPELLLLILSFMPTRSFHNFISTCFSIYDLGSVVLRSKFTVSYERQLGGLWAFWNAGRVGRLIGGIDSRELVRSVDVGFYDGRHVKEEHYLRLDMGLLCELLSSFRNVSSLRIEQVVLPIAILRILILRWVNLKTLEARYFKDVKVPPISTMEGIPLKARLNRMVFLPGSSPSSYHGTDNFLLEVMHKCDVKTCVVDWITLDRVLRKSQLSRPRTLRMVVLGPPSPWLDSESSELGDRAFEKLGWWTTGISKLKGLNFRTCISHSWVRPDMRLTNFVGPCIMFDEWMLHFPEEAGIHSLSVEDASTRWLLEIGQRATVSNYLEKLTVHYLKSVSTSSDIRKAVEKLSRLSELRVSISGKPTVPITLIAENIIKRATSLVSLWCKYEGGQTVNCDEGWEMLENCGLLETNERPLCRICVDDFYIWIKMSDGGWERHEGQLGVFVA